TPFLGRRVINAWAQEGWAASLRAGTPHGFCYALNNKNKEKLLAEWQSREVFVVLRILWIS
ncbi:MAG: hypothetical protein LBB36_06895, partial [Fibromonadaceae bacterium]|nr:hypothetical protein [Fibromonadaceae bacterium]